LSDLVRVLVADDSEIFRSACCRVVDTATGFELVGTAASGEEAVDRVVELRPDLVLMDVRMPGMGGIEAAARTQEVAPETIVVLMSVDSGASSADSAFAVVGKRSLTPSALKALWESARRHD